MADVLNIRLKSGCSTNSNSSLNAPTEWGSIEGNLVKQTDLINYIDDNIEEAYQTLEDKISLLRQQLNTTIQDIEAEIPSNYLTANDLNNYTSKEELMNNYTEIKNEYISLINSLESKLSESDTDFIIKLNTLKAELKKYTDEAVESQKDLHNEDIARIDTGCAQNSLDIENIKTLLEALRASLNDFREASKAYTDLQISKVNNTDEIMTDLEDYIDSEITEVKTNIKTEIIQTLNINSIIDEKSKNYYEALNEKIDNIDIPKSPDLSKYALKSDIPVIPSHDKYALKTDIPNDYVKNATLSLYVKKEDLPEDPDLSEYAKLTDLPSYSVSESEIMNIKAGISTNKLNIDTLSWEHRVINNNINANKDKIDNLESNFTKLNTSINSHFDDVSAKLNDHVDKEGQALKAYVDARIGENTDEHNTIVDRIYEYVDSEIRNSIVGIATEKIPHILGEQYYTKEKIDELIPKNYITAEALNPYLKKEDLPQFATLEYISNNYVSKYELNRNYLTSSLTNEKLNDLQNYVRTGYAKKDHTHSEYLTEHQSLAGYAKKTDIPSLEGYAKLTDIPNASVNIDLSGYAKKTDIPRDYVKYSLLIDYAKLSNLDEYVKNSELNSYATKEELNSISKESGVKLVEIPIAEYYAKKELNLLEENVLYAAPGESRWVPLHEFMKLKEEFKKMWKEFAKLKAYDTRYCLISKDDYENLLASGKIISGIKYLIMKDGYDIEIVDSENK